MPEPALARGSKGDLVAVLQKGLAAQGLYTGTVDGDFGGVTASAVEAQQALMGLAEDGRATPPVWTRATGMPWPELFERCLQLTARFEGHGYRSVAGNWDKAGLTWGIIGFTLKHGEIQALLLEVHLRQPELLLAAFGETAVAKIRELAGASLAEQMAWAESVSLPPKKVRVAEPWRSAFIQLGGDPFVQELQRRRARQKYFAGAQATAAELGLETERGIALCFDIHVQNGGVKKKDQQAYADQVAALPANAAEREKRSILAQLVAASSKFPADVLSRKGTLATGRGEVHGELFDLDSWALAD
ncbi:MAG TPA: peptidoglycan-binding domain-containing protein [Thermoanaerobaculia bacterium]|nr:peptidoglycan-binding domain-containing protein [Thermoanaerobaculia bacterium]